MGAIDRFLKRGRIQDFSRSPIAKMLSVLRKFGANGHLYIPGPGIQILGPELLTASATWTTGGGMSVSNGVITGTGGSGALRLQPHASTLTIGKRYKVFLTLSDVSSGQISLPYDGANGQNKSAAGSYEYEFVATTNDVYIYSSSFVGTATAYSCKEVLGYTNTISGITAGNYLDSIGTTSASVDGNVGLVKDQPGSLNATQSTTGYQPKLRRGIVNNYTYSHNASNVAYTKTNITVSAPSGAQKITPDAGTAQHYVSKTYTSASGNAYTKAVAAKADGFDFVWLYGSNPVAHAYFNVATGKIGNVTGGTATIAQDSDGYYVCTLSCTATGAEWAFETHSVGSNGGGSTTTGDGTKGTLLKACAVFDGTLTAQQILDAGGIPLTTTAPASSAAGAYKWEFDGTKNLAAPSPVFQQSDDYAVVIVARLGPNATARYLFNGGYGSSGQRAGAIYTTASGSIGFGCTDDTSAAVNLVSLGGLQGQTLVITAVKVGNTRRLRINGIQVDSSTAALGATTLVGACIGDWKPAGGNQFIGDIFSVTSIKGTVSDAQLLIEERGANALSKYAAGRF